MQVIALRKLHTFLFKLTFDEGTALEVLDASGKLEKYHQESKFPEYAPEFSRHGPSHDHEYVDHHGEDFGYGNGPIFGPMRGH